MQDSFLITKKQIKKEKEKEKKMVERKIKDLKKTIVLIQSQLNILVVDKIRELFSFRNITVESRRS